MTGMAEPGNRMTTEKPAAVKAGESGCRASESLSPLKHAEPVKRGAR